MTGIDPFLLGAMVGRQLPFFSLIVPFWLIWAFAGWKGMKDIWPAILVTGVSFAIPQFLISNFINPWIVDIGASLISMACLSLFLQVWQPKVIWTSPALRSHDASVGRPPPRKPTAEADNRTGMDVAAAVDHRLRHPAAVGHKLVQGSGQSMGDLELSRFRICTT